MWKPLSVGTSPNAQFTVQPNPKNLSELGVEHQHFILMSSAQPGSKSHVVSLQPLTVHIDKLHQAPSSLQVGILSDGFSLEFKPLTDDG